MSLCTWSKQAKDCNYKSDPMELDKAVKKVWHDLDYERFMVNADLKKDLYGSGWHLEGVLEDYIDALASLDTFLLDEAATLWTRRISGETFTIEKI